MFEEKFLFHQFYYNTTNTFGKDCLKSKMQVRERWLIQVWYTYLHLFKSVFFLKNVLDNFQIDINAHL